jgi:hypothetical protein
MCNFSGAGRYFQAIQVADNRVTGYYMLQSPNLQSIYSCFTNLVRVVNHTTSLQSESQINNRNQATPLVLSFVRLAAAYKLYTYH